MSFKRLLYQVLLWRGLYVLSALGLNILLARYYGASGSSTIYYLINLYSFVLLSAGLSLESGMSYFLANGEATAGSLAKFSGLWTIALSMISFLLLEGYFHFFDPDIPAGMFRLSALTFIPGQLLITFFTALYYARESPIIPNSLLLVTNGILVLLLIVAMAMPAMISPRNYLNLYFLGTLIQGILLALVFQLKYATRDAGGLPDISLLRKIFRFSLLAFTANIIFFLVYRVDYWFVKRYCSPAELGNYIQVSRLGQVALILPGMLAAVIFPRTILDQDKPEQMSLRLARLIRLSVIFFVLLFLGLLLTGRWFFPAILGASFDRMYTPMLILLPGILFLSILTPLSAYFGGLHRPGVNVRGAFAGLAVIIIGDSLLIPRWGILAAAAVSSAGYFTCMLYSMLEFSRSNGIGLRSLLSIKKEDFRI